MKVLYLDTNVDESNDYIRKRRMEVYDVDSFCIYNTKKKNLLFKMIQFFGIYFFSPLLYFIYGDWKKKVNDYDVIIITSRKSCKYAIQKLKKKTNKRIIVWYWNLITNKELLPAFCKKYGCETWTFDIEDSKKYNMHFNDTYYFWPEEVEKNDKNMIELEYDMFYCGENKRGREEQLLKIAEYCKKNGLRYKFFLHGSDCKEFINKRISYEDMIKYIKMSKAIIDLNVSGQSGLTLRVLESLFLKKLLITNNNEIVKYKAYQEENTYIIKSKLDGLEEFLERKYYSNDEEKRKYYLFSSWLKRILDVQENDDK